MTTSPTDRSARVAALFDRVADTYDSVGVPWFGPIADGLVAAMAAEPGERAVDLGCGQGAALLPLAAAVGPSGHVTGTDLAPRMLARAAEKVREAGLANVDLQVMDVATPTLPPGEADLVVASLVLFFLPAPAEALRAWARLLRPGGRLGVSTFGPRDDVQRRLDELFTPYLPPHLLDARTSGTSGPFADDASMEALFTAAGLVDVSTSHAQVTIGYTGVDHWVRWSRSHGQRQMWEHVPAAAEAELSARAGGILKAARGDDGLSRVTQDVRYTLGRHG